MFDDFICDLLSNEVFTLYSLFSPPCDNKNSAGRKGELRYTTEIPSPMGGGQMTMEVDSIKLNPSVDEAIFKKPAKK